jgi:plastocyanin domain-containing protein
MRAVIALLAGLALVAGCQTGEHAHPQQEPKEKQAAKLDKDGVQRVKVTGGSYYFKPGHIVVKANVPVELLASRESGMTPHNLVIKAPEAGIAVEAELATEPKKITFTPKKPGKYEFYCAKKPPLLASHRERGMVGVLEVVP